MKQCFAIALIQFLSLACHAIEGLNELEKMLFEKNQEYLALNFQRESKHALSESTKSLFYPTISAVTGWGQNRTEELVKDEKGLFGYGEAKINFFRGFKDQTQISKRELDVQLADLELEKKKRELRLELTEIASNMVLLHSLEQILEDEFRVTQGQKKMAAKKVSAGLTGAVDSLEFDLRESEIQIQKRQIYQQHQEAHQRLIKFFGEDIKDEKLEKIHFSSLAPRNRSNEKIDLEKTLEFRRARLLQAQAELEFKEVRSEYLPSIDLTFLGGRLTPSEENPIQFHESKLALMVTIPLFSGFETYHKSQSAALLSQSAESLKMQKRNDVESDLKIALAKREELIALYEINESKIQNSKKYFDLTLAEYKRGVKNSPDLVNATERLFASKKKRYELLKDSENINCRIENF